MSAGGLPLTGETHIPPPSLLILCLYVHILCLPSVVSDLYSQLLLLIVTSLAVSLVKSLGVVLDT